MSIPPLVCSTPPPPDQCEEDKDPEDFDISYNLSQDDDDDYNFRNFPSYSNIQSSVNTKDDSSDNVEILSSCKVKTPIQVETIGTYTEEHYTGLNISTASKKCEDEVNIEDLELEISEDSIETSTKAEIEVINGSNKSSISESNVVNEVTEDHLRTLSPSPVTEDNSVESLSIDDNKHISRVDVAVTPDFEVDVSTESFTTPNSDTEQVICSETIEPYTETINVDDDFDEFQFASTENKPLPVIVTFNNPWDINEPINDDFGNFTANFETVEENVLADSFTESMQPRTDSFNETMQPGTDSFTETMLPGTDSCTETVQPGTDSFTETMQPGTDSFTETMQPVTDSFTETMQPRTDSFTETMQPGTDSFTENMQPGTDSFTENMQPGSDSFTETMQPGTDSVTRTMQPGTDSFTATMQSGTQSDVFNNLIASNGEDDFGDFDDFKSSTGDSDTNCVSNNPLPNQQGPGIDFHLSDNENQLMESITNVLSSIFKEEVTEPDVEFEGKLETMLSETWRHLRETDIRQPYIVNWNNSLGQKTLLKALCIDSRNILFGPKWSYNMPKYAVNLNNAPLQPQKPLIPSSSSLSEAVSSDKTAPKHDGWVDPFTSDGQDSCSTETDSVVEVTSSDLDVFEAAISTKSEKKYPSTLNVQPLRQINLPDTHIFTPTDSETPRSKTIHYDSVPSILMPKPITESMKAVVESFPTQTTETSKENNNDDDDDWEFQDFKCSAGSIATGPQLTEQPMVLKSENNSKPNITYQTQVLQPIKMEPLTPSLNWPNPGEVKETFEDFSGFVSKTSWKTEQPHILSPQESSSIVQSDTLENVSGRLTLVEKTEKDVQLQPVFQAKHDSFDDEFDTFQCALPPKNSTVDFAIESNTYDNIPNQDANQSPSLIKNFDYTFPKNNKSDTISVENTRLNEALTHNLGCIPEVTTSKHALSSVLQSLPVNSSATQKQQKTAQILQPLSLESYSQINWPNPGIDLQDLSRFNPVETLQSLKTELSAAGGPSKRASPVHVQKNTVIGQVPDEDIWGEFVSSKPKQTFPKKAPVFVDDDEWTDFVSSPSVKPQNGLNTISLNVHTNSNIQKTSNINKFATKSNKVPLDIPTLNYITPKSSGHNSYNERHFQNL